MEGESWSDTLLAEDSGDFLRNLATGIITEKVLSWFLKRAKPTASYLVGRGVNAGIYSDFEPDDLIEYSAILDRRTTAGCSYLDNKRMKWSEWQKTPDMIPPRHFGCRATLVRVVEGGDENENLVDEKSLAKKDNFQNSSKKELTERNPELAKYTKKELYEMELYKGYYYEFVNGFLRGEKQEVKGVQDSIKTLEKAISKDSFKNEKVLYRGFALDSKLEVGSILSNEGFISTSTRYDIAMRFSYDSERKYRYLAEISNTKGSPKLNVDDVLVGTTGETPYIESEILLNHGKRFIIDSVKYDKGNKVYMLKAKITDDTKLLSEEKVKNTKDDKFAEMRKAIENFNIEDFSLSERKYFERKSRAMSKGMKILKPGESEWKELE